jgi:hypothetical protein
MANGSVSARSDLRVGPGCRCPHHQTVVSVVGIHFGMERMPPACPGDGYAHYYKSGTVPNPPFPSDGKAVAGERGERVRGGRHCAAPNDQAHLPGPLRWLHVTKSLHAGRVRCSDWFGDWTSRPASLGYSCASAAKYRLRSQLSGVKVSRPSTSEWNPPSSRLPRSSWLSVVPAFFA